VVLYGVNSSFVLHFLTATAGWGKVNGSGGYRNNDKEKHTLQTYIMAVSQRCRLKLK